MQDASKYKVRPFVNDLRADASKCYSRRSRRLTQITSQKFLVFICVICVICGQTGTDGRIENRVSSIEHRVSSIQDRAGGRDQVCNTPTLKSAILGWFAAAAIARARISRVRRGSMISSTHSRAAAYLGSIAFS